MCLVLQKIKILVCLFIFFHIKKNFFKYLLLLKEFEDINEILTLFIQYENIIFIKEFKIFKAENKYSSTSYH